MKRFLAVAALTAVALAGFSAEAMARARRSASRSNSEYGEILVNGRGKALYAVHEGEGAPRRLLWRCAEAGLPT